MEPGRQSVTPPLGLLAGGGALPRQIIQIAQLQKRSVFVIAFQGQTDAQTVAGVDHLWVCLGEVGRILSALRQKGVREVALAGAIQRPSWRALKTDWMGARLLARLSTQFLGDDGLLTFLTEFIETEGFRVLPTPQLVPSLLYPPGPVGFIEPDETALTQISQAVRILDTLSAFDIGQSLVMQQGLVLGIEAAEGTDALIERCTQLQKTGASAILIKRAKIGQTHAADLPTIGPKTLKRCIEGRFQGIAFQAGKTLVLEADTLRAQADLNHLFLFAVP